MEYLFAVKSTRTYTVFEIPSIPGGNKLIETCEKQIRMIFRIRRSKRFAIAHIQARKLSVSNIHF